MENDERGYIVVETVSAFTLFIFLVVSILSLINIVVVQARVHFAMTQTAETLSMYCYSLAVTGVSDEIVNLETEANKFRVEADTFKSGVNDLLDGIYSISGGNVLGGASSAFRGGKGALTQLQDWASDPKDTIRLIIDYGLSEAGGELVPLLIKPMMKGYLANGEESGDEYLRKMKVIDGIDGLDFTEHDGGSRLLDQDGNVKITAVYEVEYKFGALPLPFEPKLTIAHTVKTKAWLNGSGDGYDNAE